MIASPLSSLILGLDNVLSLHGWQWLFIVEGAPALILAVAVFIFLPDGPEDARWLTQQERATIKSSFLAEDRSNGDGIHDVWRALADERVILLCAAYFAFMVGLYGITYWLPQMVQAMGVSVAATGFVVAVPYAVTCVVLIVWARHSDMAQERIWHVALAALLGAFGFAASAMLNAPLLVLIALTFAAAGIYSIIAPFWAMPSQFLSSTGRAAGIALINSVGNLGGFLGPYAVGWALQETGGYAGGMAVLAASMTIGAVLVLALGRFKRFALAA